MMWFKLKRQGVRSRLDMLENNGGGHGNRHGRGPWFSYGFVWSSPSLIFRSKSRGSFKRVPNPRSHRLSQIGLDKRILELKPGNGEQELGKSAVAKCGTRTITMVKRLIWGSLPSSLGKRFIHR